LKGKPERKRPLGRRDDIKIDGKINSLGNLEVD
jgi:hypothetical protein